MAVSKGNRKKKQCLVQRHSKLLPSSRCTHGFTSIYIHILVHIACVNVSSPVCTPFPPHKDPEDPESEAKTSVEVGPAYHSRSEWRGGGEALPSQCHPAALYLPQAAVCRLYDKQRVPEELWLISIDRWAKAEQQLWLSFCSFFFSLSLFCFVFFSHREEREREKKRTIVKHDQLLWCLFGTRCLKRLFTV